MVFVLMGENHQVQHIAGGFAYVINDILWRGLDELWRPLFEPTIDQDVNRFATALPRIGEQETIAMADAIHSNDDPVRWWLQFGHLDLLVLMQKCKWFVAHSVAVAAQAAGETRIECVACDASFSREKIPNSIQFRFGC